MFRFNAARTLCWSAVTAVEFVVRWTLIGAVELAVVLDVIPIFSNIKSVNRLLVALLGAVVECAKFGDVCE